MSTYNLDKKISSYYSELFFIVSDEDLEIANGLYDELCVVLQVAKGYKLFVAQANPRNDLVFKPFYLKLIKNMLTKGQISQRAFIFLKILIIKLRIYNLENILLYLDEFLIEKSNKIRVFLSTARDITEKKKISFKEKMRQSINREIVLVHNIDLNLLGGYQIKFSSYFLDYSLKKMVVHWSQKIKKESNIKLLNYIKGSYVNVKYKNL